MDGRALLDAIEKSFLSERGTKSITAKAFADELGVTVQTLSAWRARKSWRPSEIATLLRKRANSVEKKALRGAIVPIVEFLQLDYVESKQGARWEIFEPKGTYLQGLKQRLVGSCGVYVFYDSRGRAIYAGKTERQKEKLWGEINGAFNRHRNVQQIKRVDHPFQNVEFTTGGEKQRQIYSRPVQLHELASYLSVYEISPPLISKVEALLVRGFANDLLNVRMERFIRKRPR